MIRDILIFFHRSCDSGIFSFEIPCLSSNDSALRFEIIHFNVGVFIKCWNVVFKNNIGFTFFVNLLVQIWKLLWKKIIKPHIIKGKNSNYLLPFNFMTFYFSEDHGNRAAERRFKFNFIYNFKINNDYSWHFDGFASQYLYASNFDGGIFCFKFPCLYSNQARSISNL